MAGAISLNFEELSFVNVNFSTFLSIESWLTASIAYMPGADFPECIMSRYK